MTLKALTVRAELARRGLLSNQLHPYENPDTERMVYPVKEPETIEAAFDFIRWIERAATFEVPT